MLSLHALLLAKANTQLLVDVQHGGTAPQWTGVKGQPTTAELIQQHAAPPQPATPAAPPDTGEPAVSSFNSLPIEIYNEARRGELRKVASWLRKGGSVDARGPDLTDGGHTAVALLHVAAANGQLEM
eukprot:scaffold110875_cov56-Phaeocystis_antarctica.AAC.2